jgi:hypothetical protein
MSRAKKKFKNQEKNQTETEIEDRISTHILKKNPYFNLFE